MDFKLDRIVLIRFCFVWHPKFGILVWLQNESHLSLSVTNEFIYPAFQMLHQIIFNIYGMCDQRLCRVFVRCRVRKITIFFRSTIQHSRIGRDVTWMTCMNFVKIYIIFKSTIIYFATVAAMFLFIFVPRWKYV